MPTVVEARTGRSGGLVLLTLATAQFLMTLDSSVMNVSIATVAKDVGTTVTGIQLAITLYTLVMAAFMITGGKIGQIIGRRRAFQVGCVIYGFGSLTTSLAHSLPVLLIGWSVLEGLGATLIMPSVVALVATNFGASERPRAYGLIASASAIAVAAGPLIGGLCTTYLSWRVVFAGEVVLVLVILALSTRVADAAREHDVHLDLAGTVLIAVLTTTFLGAVASDPAVPSAMASKAQVELSAGIPFVSDADLSSALAKADVPTQTADAIVADNASARINGLRAALALLALFALVGLALTRRLPTVQPGDEPARTVAVAGPLPDKA
jgi:MFS family permease